MDSRSVIGIVMYDIVAYNANGDMMLNIPPGADSANIANAHQISHSKK